MNRLAGLWRLTWDLKINTEGSKRFIQGVIVKYNYTPNSCCCLGYAVMTQILKSKQCAGTTDTAVLIRALEGYECDGLKEGGSYLRPCDHHHVQDVRVWEVLGKEMGLVY